VDGHDAMDSAVSVTQEVELSKQRSHGPDFENKSTMGTTRYK
jgi:hypothetical protein